MSRSKKNWDHLVDYFGNYRSSGSGDGDKGAKGATGDRGPIGLTGDQGADGAKGDEGGLFHFRGETGTEGGIPPTPAPIAGDVWKILTPEVHYVVWDETEWVEITLELIAGPPGAPGNDGGQGIPGENGEDGEDGDSAYEVYLEQTNDNPVKSPLEWLESLVGPQGDQGNPGLQGDKGEDSTFVEPTGDELTYGRFLKGGEVIGEWRRAVAVTGDTMTGDLTTIAPTDDAHAANKKYVDDQRGRVGMSDNFPDGTEFEAGTLWLKTSTMSLHVWIGYAWVKV